MDAGEREASLVVGLLFLRQGIDLGVDKGALVVGALRVVLAPGCTIDDKKADILADLRCCQPDALGFAERQEHVFHEFLHLGIIGRDPLAGLAQHVRTINYYRINHLLNSI